MLRLKIVRVSQGRTQFSISIAARMSQGHYSALERALIAPTPDERERLAHILQTPSSTLFRSIVRERKPSEETIANGSGH